MVAIGIIMFDYNRTGVHDVIHVMSKCMYVCVVCAHVDLHWCILVIINDSAHSR